MQAHKYADAFPMLSESELKELAEDIKNHGQAVPVLVDEDGKIIDGRNRAAACESLGIEPAVETFHGTDAEKMERIVSLNLKRRNLTPEQAAIAAAKLANWAHGSNRYEKKVECSKEHSTFTQQDAADRMGVSKAQVRRAKSVLKNGSTELIKAVENGDIKLTRAEMIAKQPVKEQREEVTQMIVKTKSEPSKNGSKRGPYDTGEVVVSAKMQNSAFSKLCRIVAKMTRKRQARLAMAIIAANTDAEDEVKAELFEMIDAGNGMFEDVNSYNFGYHRFKKHWVKTLAVVAKHVTEEK